MYYLSFDCATKTFAYSLSYVNMDTISIIENMKIFADSMYATEVKPNFNNFKSQIINLIDGEVIDFFPKIPDNKIDNVERIKKISESIDNLEPFSEERDAFATAVLGGSVQLSIDGDGRVILPENLLKTAKIKDNAVFVGKGSTFEIWEPKSFNVYLEKAKAEAKLKRNMLRLNK